MKWIKLNERLPEKGNEKYVCRAYNEGTKKIVTKVVWFSLDKVFESRLQIIEWLDESEEVKETMTPKEILNKKFISPSSSDWYKPVIECMRQYASIQSAKDKERIKLLDEMLQQNGINSLTGKPYINQKDKERIAELEADNAEYEKDTKHLNDLLNSALKEKEELEKLVMSSEIKVERLKNVIHDAGLNPDTGKPYFADLDPSIFNKRL